MPLKSSQLVLHFCMIAVACSGWLVEEAKAQRKGSFGNGGSFANRGSSANRGSFDVGMILKAIDSNKNGMLDPSEMAGRTKSFVRQAGLDPNRAHAISTITQKLNERKTTENGKTPKTTGSDGSGSTERKVPGFGVDREAPFVPDFSPSGEERMSIGAMKRKFSASVMSQVERAFTRYDRDKNGLIDGTEQSRTRWSNPSASESDTNKDGNLSRLEMAYRYKNREDEALNKKNKNTVSHTTTGTKISTKSVKSLSKQLEAGGKYKYNPSRNPSLKSYRSSQGKSAARSTRTSSASRNSRSGYSTRPDKYRRYATGLINNLDKDGDKKLSKEEMKEMRRPVKNADTNKDGFVDSEELFVAVRPSSKDDDENGSSREAKSSSRFGSKVLDSKRRKANKAYNSGDSIFGGKDVNNDRQLQMSEFASDWDEKTVDEFKAKDLNDDGVITEKEWKS